MEQLKSFQYFAGLAITGAGKVIQETKYAWSLAENCWMTEGGAVVLSSSLSSSINLHRNIQDILFHKFVGQIMVL